MKHLTNLLTLLACLGLTLGCGHSDHDGDHGHPHGAGDTDDHEHDSDGGNDEHGDDDEHDEVSLGSVTLGTHEVELLQGHGAVAAGKECHLVVRLPYADSGSTVVRAWIGTEDRLASFVGKGMYAPAHNDYDIHVLAPDPMPEGAQWWLELELPDGSKLVGSHAPLLE